MRFAVQTARTRMSVMSISGCALLTSTATQAAQITPPTTSIPIVFAEPQPHVVVSLIAIRTSVIPALISAAAGQLIRPGTRTGDSGTKRHVQTAATTISDERQPEQPVPAQVLHDRGAGEDADAAADPEQRRHEPDAAGDALARELVADDPEREREDAAADALDRARDDQQRERARDAGEQRARAEHDERPDEQALLAVHVAEPADDRGADGGREQIRSEHPGDPVLGGVQVVLDRRQRRHDRRAEHRERETGDREHRQRHVRMAALRVLHPRRLTTPPPRLRRRADSSRDASRHRRPSPRRDRVFPRASAPDEGDPGRARRDHDRALRVGGRRPVAQGRPAPRAREAGLRRRGVRDDRRLLPRLHPRLDPDARRVADPRAVPGRAAGRDGLDAREVPARAACGRRRRAPSRSDGRQE